MANPTWMLLQGASGSGLNPTTRGTAIVSSVGSGASLAVSLPAGSAAGDLAIIQTGHFFALTSISPGSWNQLQRDAGTSYVNGATYWKILSSTEISAGSITVGYASSGEGVLAITVFQGATAGIRETKTQQSGTGSFTSPVTAPSTSSAVLNSDKVVYFTMNRAASTDTVNRGSQQRTANNGSLASGCLYTEDIVTSGAVASSFSYTSTGPGYAISIVVVKGV